ncbi:hypothetical protein M3583_23600, partial [Bacillus subtilis]|nr:hypothetical protein [Bacillus subtilis]
MEKGFSYEESIVLPQTGGGHIRPVQRGGRFGVGPIPHQAGAYCGCDGAGWPGRHRHPLAGAKAGAEPGAAGD